MKIASPVGRSKIEDYAFLSDTQSGALVSRDGCVDWLCLPRFDSGACFAALLGGPENGTWRLTPQEKIKKRERRYRGDTLILETDLHTSGGAVRYIDFMPPRGTNPDMVRIIEGLAGQVTIRRMAGTGLLMDVAAILVITTVTYFLGPWLLSY